MATGPTGAGGSVVPTSGPEGSLVLVGPPAPDGEIGSVSNDSFVFMGLIPNVVPLIEKAIPNLVNRFKDDGVEAALLVPS